MKSQTLRSLSKEILGLAAILLSIMTFESVVYGKFTIPTGSMKPTVQIGDKILVNMMAYDLRFPFTNISILRRSEPSRGDIVVFDYPKKPSVRYVKRLVGLPGDSIVVSNGFITVNGKPVETDITSRSQAGQILNQGGVYREHLSELSYEVRRSPNSPIVGTRKWIVPEDHYFMMGDNRDRSADSRVWGFVPRNHLRGKAKLTYFSLDWSDESWIPRIRTERIGQDLYL